MNSKMFYSMLLCIFLIGSPARAGERIAPIQRIVRLEHRLVNESAKPETIEMFIALPQSNERQDVRWVYPEPGYREILTDEYGNTIVRYRDEHVPAGEVVCHGWIAEVELFSCLYEWRTSQNEVNLSAEEKNRYLQDTPNYDFKSDYVTRLSEQLCAGKSTPLEKVRTIFSYLTNELNYCRDLVWDPAPVVLQRKSGSCSEYNYAFLALCRAAGIPCRYSGGVVLRPEFETRYDSTAAEDAVFHRWSEVFLDDIGWFPVDCSRGSTEIKRFGNPYNQFGQLPAGVLQTVRGDGAGHSPLGWDYLSKEKVSFTTSGKESKVGFWLDHIPAGQCEAECLRLEKAFAGKTNLIPFEELLRSALTRELVFLFRNQIPPEAYPRLISALNQRNHPDAIYWTVLARKRGVKLPFHQTYPFLCDEDLTQEVKKYLNAEAFDLVDFEYWWRKARPLIVRDGQSQLFRLPEKELNLF